MEYRDALDLILGLTDYERYTYPSHRLSRNDLGRVTMLLENLGNPHAGIPTIHIAGTKGKGSTSAMCASILKAGRSLTGMYISPHLHTFCERICMDGKPVTQEEFASLTETIWPAMTEVNNRDEYERITVFEILTAMAFTCFKNHTAQVQVIEAGMGGRLDATNVITPSACIITSLSLDHTATLGNKIELIAREKAGIIKPWSTVVSAPQTPEALAVIKSVCQDKNARLLIVGQDILWERDLSSPNGQSYCIKGRLNNYSGWMPLLGTYQLENAATAIGALEVLQDQGFKLSKQDFEKGLRTVEWPCRMEVLDRSPLVVADGAHNPFSMQRLRESLPIYFRYSNIILVTGINRDKNLDTIVAEMAALQPKVIVTQSRHPRATSTSDIASLFSKQGLQATQVHNVKQAVRQALEWATQNDLVLITGSLFVAAEAREELKGIPPEIHPKLQLDRNPTQNHGPTTIPR